MRLIENKNPLIRLVNNCQFILFDIDDVWKIEEDDDGL
jgi:hypothetical protein